MSAVVAVVMARKKHSAQSGVRVTKGYATPPDAIRRGEIVEEIVDHLRPWKDRVIETAATADVNYELNELHGSVCLKATWSDRARNRAHAKKLDSALLQLETLLAAAPVDLSLLLFMDLSVPPQITNIISGDARRTFAAELKRLRKVCALAVHPQFGSPANYDHAKHLSARSAHSLMQKLSKTKPSGTKDKAFRAIASLLYEGVSGIRNADLKRACASALHDNRSRELGTA